jgi:cytoskeletal protein RodZ
MPENTNPNIENLLQSTDSAKTSAGPGILQANTEAPKAVEKPFILSASPVVEPVSAPTSATLTTTPEAPAPAPTRAPTAVKEAEVKTVEKIADTAEELQDSTEIDEVKKKTLFGLKLELKIIVGLIIISLIAIGVIVYLGWFAKPADSTDKQYEREVINAEEQTTAGTDATKAETTTDNATEVSTDSTKTTAPSDAAETTSTTTTTTATSADITATDAATTATDATETADTTIGSTTTTTTTTTTNGTATPVARPKIKVTTPSVTP